MNSFKHNRKHYGTLGGGSEGSTDLTRRAAWLSVLALPLLTMATSSAVFADEFAQTEQDRHLAGLLTEKRSKWRDLNVPYRDGVFLRDFIRQRSARSIVEIGTSTGHSGLWIAWALTKTGGKLTTFEIDKQRFQTAQQNFTQARVASHIDSRLESARTGILPLERPIDMVFLDGDHNNYRYYFDQLAPKLSANGCIIAHNVGASFWDTAGYLKMVRAAPGFATKIVRPNNDPIAVTCRV